MLGGEEGRHIRGGLPRALGGEEGRRRRGYSAHVHVPSWPLHPCAPPPPALVRRLYPHAIVASIPRERES
jgi:hypothetical protein